MCFSDDVHQIVRDCFFVMRCYENFRFLLMHVCKNMRETKWCKIIVEK